ncbi:MAG TPA: proline iminopeptidase-family hydrolase [Nocardioides sp.]|nr:proline iminopeptidase-family hydrolase [Nocardioides sp.]
MHSDGVRTIEIDTPSGRFGVWTRTVGDTSGTTILVLHGGPGATHEYLLDLEQPLTEAGFGVVFYDQLGSHFSDQPDDPTLWEIPRFVDEVEQVRTALGLDASTFVLYGQSWGGVLATEYALAHPTALKGLVISNMMSSIPSYNEYAQQVLLPEMDPDALARIKELEAAGDTINAEYEALLAPHYERHVLRRPMAEWPAHVLAGFEHINYDIYVPLQGPSELGASGKLLDWDRSGDLHTIDVPTLVMGAQHDTMDPAHKRWMADQLPQGTYLHCPDGSHLSLVDDHDVYIAGLLDWLRELG